MSTDLHPNPRLEERLRDAFDAVIPRLVDDAVESAMEHGERSDERAWGRDPVVEEQRRSRLLGIAAAVLLVGGAAAVWSARTRSDLAVTDPATPASVDISATTSAASNSTQVGSTVSTVVTPPTGSSVPCLIEDCTPVDRLPVVDGAFDFYAGPESLGTPVVNGEMLDQFGLVRCRELTIDGAACLTLEGLARVALVEYPGSGVAVGTTFTSVSPMDYATGDPRLGGNPEVSSGGLVRGHEAVRAADESSVSLVWGEREGVLAWVQVPVAMSNELSAIAEGLRTLDGPTTMPHLVVAGLGRAWDTYDNDADGVVYARVGGARCLGIGWVPDPCSTYVTRSSLDGSATIEIAGVGPSGAATARFGLEDGSSYDFELTDIDGIADAQLFYGLLPAVGQTYSVTWLSADGSELAEERLDFPSTAFDGDVVGATSTPASGAAAQPTSEGWSDGAVLRVYFVNGASDSDVAAVREALLAHPDVMDVERLTYLDEKASLAAARVELAEQPGGMVGLNESNVPSRLNVFAASGVAGAEVAALVEALGIESFAGVVSVARPDA
jgi:hypothetical protein